MKKILLVLLLLIFYGCYLAFFKLLFGYDELVEIKGSLTKTNSFVKTDTLKNKQVIKNAYLCFNLRDDKRVYTLKVNIDSVYGGVYALAGVKRSIENAGQITVSIKRVDMASTAPKVFLLYADDENVFEITKTPWSNAKISFFIILAIILSTAIYYAYLNRKRIVLKFSPMFGKPPNIGENSREKI